MSQYKINDSNSNFNTINSFNNNNVWNNCTFAEDRSELLTWLSPLEPGLRHSDIREHRVNDVGEWLMRTEEFRRWHGLDGEGQSDKEVLFCYGDPGAGKTFISSLVVDRLCDRTQGRNMAVTCFYFDFAARKEQTATSMLGSLLKQMVSRMESIPQDILRALREQRKAVSGSRPQLGDIVKMLQAITSSQPTFMCIDALDECTAAQRFKLFDSLKQILDVSPGTRVFMTGRPHIRAEIERRLAGRVRSVYVGPSKGDIATYLRARLSEDETPEAMDDMLEAEILEKIPENMSEMFILVSLNIEAILHESTIHRRRERLNTMANGRGLDDAYGATIERIKAQDGDKSRLGMGVLMWISHVEWPLTADELCHALAVELGSRDFNSGNIPSISILVSCCQGLITVDKEASTVRLIHFTLREYLSAHPDIFSRPHSAMAEICLTYLNSKQVKAISIGPEPDTRGGPFLRYCSLYWGVHAKRELSNNAISLALELFQEYNGHISTQFLLRGPHDLYFWNLPDDFRFSGLHCASRFGIAKFVATLIEMGCYDINEGDWKGYTPLVWAARNGHEDVVTMLLGREEVNPDKPDNDGRTPFLYAAWYGHAGVVKILLGREEVSAHKPDNDGRTPLLYAAANGCVGVVEILLERKEVNPDKPGGGGITPLMYAARFGYEGVVKILLERKEVNPDKPGNDGRTPLSYAAGYGHEGVVKILLERKEVNPDQPNKDGRTPLSYAVEGEDEKIVEMLLGCEAVNPNRPDNMQKTPLMRAAERGHEGIMALLQPYEAVAHRAL